MSKQAKPIRSIRAKSIETMKFRLLSTANRKFLKSLTDQQSVVGLSLAAAKSSGYELCPRRSPGCTNVCIMNEGFGHMPRVKDARILKAQNFVQDQSNFLGNLHYDLQRLELAAQLLQKDVYVRLNTFSDIAWEQVDPTLFDYNLTYYDYTKREDRCERYLHHKLPDHYHLIFSLSELNAEYAKYFLSQGGNINAVYRDAQFAPDTLFGYPTDKSYSSDLWWIGKSSIVGIAQALGEGMYDTTGFVLD